jgi:hypothetical protein
MTRSRVLSVSATLIVVLAVAMSARSADATGTTTTFGFGAPYTLSGSTGLGEPSLAIDGNGRRFVTAPQSLGNASGGGSPVWTSTNGGASFGAPVRPVGDAVSGGDTDLTFDPAQNNIYQVDLWLGNSAMAVSTDHGASFIANEYGHVQPGDDRPWLAFSRQADAMYLAYDGVDAIHVAKTAPLATAAAGLTFPQDVPAVPECLIGGSNPCSSPPVRQCVCPPGGIAVDQVSGSVYVSYSRQNGAGLGGGVGIARSDNGGLTWTYLSIPGTGSTGSAFDTEYNFIPVKVDSAGNVYALWAEGRNIDANGVAAGGVAIRYAYSKDHGVTWSTPLTVSTTSNGVFPTMDIVSPGVVDLAYYGTSAGGDPNLVPATASWNLYSARTTTGLGTPAFTTATAATAVHTGCIQVGGHASCSDRSLLDFFQLVVDHVGKANIIFTVGNVSSGTKLEFVKQS